MPTLLDQLIIELQLDPAKFRKETRQLESDFKKLTESAVKRSKDYEDRVRSITDAVSLLSSRFLQLFALAAGGKGLKDFAKDIQNTNLRTGEMARSTAFGVEQIGRWQRAIQLAGGTAEEANSAIQGMNDAMANWNSGLNNDLVPSLQRLGVLGGQEISITEGIESVFLKSALAIQKLNQEKPGYAKAYAERAGISGKMFDLLARPDVLRLLQKGDLIGGATKASVDNAQKLLEIWSEIVLRTEKVGHNILSSAVVTDLLNKGLGGLYPEERVTGGMNDLRSMVRTIFGPSTEAQWFGAKAAPGGAGSAGLRLKAGATGGGDVSVGLYALAASLQNEIPELKQFTALNDAYHAGTGSKHAQGLALDFSLSNPAKSAAVASAVRAKLLAMGIDAQVLDEYLNPSLGSTGGHIHVGFANAAAAARYSQLVGAGAVTNSSSSTNSNDINIQNLHVSMSNATNAKELREGLEAMAESYSRRRGLAAQANGLIGP